MAKTESIPDATPGPLPGSESLSASARSPLTLAVMQCASLPLQVEANLQRLEAAAARARAAGAHVLLTPEMFLTGYSIGAEAVQALAQPRDGGYAQAVTRIAVTHQIAIVWGYPEREADGALFNAAQWTSAQGTAVLHYRKTHLYGALDRAQFSAGMVNADISQLATLHGWRVGLLICYDVEFPENTRRLALAGADCVLVPTANMDRYDFVPRTLVPARAFENQMVLAYANYCGPEGKLRYGGLSSIVDALGQPLALAGRDESLLFATLTPEALAHARSEQTHLQEHALRMHSSTFHRDSSDSGEVGNTV
jgi:predicted amidohydrolase